MRQVVSSILGVISVVLLVLAFGTWSAVSADELPGGSGLKDCSGCGACVTGGVDCPGVGGANCDNGCRCYTTKGNCVTLVIKCL